MHLRLTKILLVCVAALFATLVAFNNITDYGSNYEYVRHVLSMDTTFPENNGMWRRIESSALHHAAYVIIIAFEAFIAALCWIGAARLWGSRADPAQFARRKTMAVWGLVCAIVLWFGGFIAIGGEWFLMWQSEVWNGQPESAMFATLYGLILLYVAQPEAPA